MSYTYNYKILGQVTPVANTLTPLYTCPSGQVAIISSLNICNMEPFLGQSGNVRYGATLLANVISTDPNVSANANVQYSDRFQIASNIIVGYNDMVAMVLGMTLETGNTLYVQATSSNVTFNLFGSEKSLQVDTLYAKGPPTHVYNDVRSFGITYLTLAGGGGGGSYWGGGGGGGGLVSSSVVVFTESAYTLTVGAGGNGGASPTLPGTNGSNTTITSSSFSSNIIAVGGGGGGARQGGENFPAPGSNRDGKNGGSGGGATSKSPVFGLGYIGQGNNGAPGATNSANWDAGGGGGGAGQAGGIGDASFGGFGGNGIINPIVFSTLGQLSSNSYYLAGGGGGGHAQFGGGGFGGIGGGGAGVNQNAAGLAGNVNTGGGGGGGGGSISGSGGTGGAGAIVIAYGDIYPDPYRIDIGLTYSKTVVSNTKIFTFTAGTGGIRW